MKILIVIESGIGNVAMMTPMIQTLHRIYDKPKITLLTSPYRKEGKILEEWKYLKKSIYSANKLKPDDFDYVFVSPLYGSVFNYFLNKIPKSKLIPINCGNKVDWHSTHEVEVNMRIPRQLLDYSDETPPTQVKTIKPKRIPKLSNKIRIGIHAGCLNHPDYRNKLWLNKKWSELAKKLIKEHNVQVIWFGAGKDYSGKSDLNLVNKYSDIRETAYMINKCDVFVSVDSGLAHIANALSVPTIVLFGPTLTSKNKPWNEGCTVINSGKCNPCYFTNRFTNCTDNFCMKNIEVHTVVDYVTEAIKKINQIKVLFIGVFDEESTNNSQYRSFCNNGCKVIKYDYRDRGTIIGRSRRDNEIIRMCNDEQPQLVLFSKCQGVDVEVVKQCNRISKTALWFMDPMPYFNAELIKKIKHCNHSFFSIWAPYIKAKQYSKKVHFLHEGYDVQVDLPLKVEYETPVSFIGNISKENRMWYWKRVKFKIYNNSHGINHARAVSESKINLNFIGNHGGTSDRAYKIMASKGFMLTEEWPQMKKDFKPNRDLVVFKDPKELKEKIKYYLAHEKERLKIADNGYKAVKKFTRDRWARLLIDTMFKRRRK